MLLVRTATKNKNKDKKFIYRHGLRKDKQSVSEAMGTILLLAVALVLIASVAAWVQTLPEIPEQKNVKFDVTYEEVGASILIIDIEHLGGDELDILETSVHISIIYPTFDNFFYELADSNNQSLEDGYWGIGEHWNYTLYGLANNAEINIKVIDDNNERVILDEDILLGELDETLPDLEISPDNITFVYQGDYIRKNRPVTIFAKIYNHGQQNASAIVRFFDGNTLITSGGKEFRTVIVPYKDQPTTKNFQRVGITWLPRSWGVHHINVKIYSTEFETNYANNYAQKDVNVEISVEPPAGPDLGIRSYDINPNLKYPVHGIDLNVSIVYHNFGDLPVRPGEEFNITVTMGNRTFTKVVTNGLRAKDSREFFVLFREVGPGGPANITVELDPEELITEENRANNIAIRYLTILPTILIVDDDGVEGGKRNVVTSLMRSFTGRGITYDFYSVRGDSDINPRFNQGPRKLINYDIVIWATGYETSNTLTDINIKNLKRWLSDNSTMNRLWLIGQDVLNSTVETPGTVNDTDFAYQYLGINDYAFNATPEILEGTLGDPITDGMYLNTSAYLAGLNRGLNLTTRPATLNDQIYPILNNETHLGSGQSVALRYHNLTDNYKVVFFSFEFTSINSPYDLSNVSFHVLKWFNYSIAEGYDFGVVEQTFSTLSPNFMDVINISAIIVNNGPEDEDVEVIFYKTGPDGIEKVIEEYPDPFSNPRTVFIGGNGGRATVYKNWLATSVGDHNFRVMVDPFNRYQEIVEENNDFSYFGVEVTKLEIQYTILVVDDDNSTNNGGPFPDAVTPIKDSLDELEYFYMAENVTGGALPGNGPNIDILKHYNTVFWLTGNDIGPTLTATDQQNIIDYIEGNYVEARYLETKVNLILVGQNLLDDLNGSGNNIQPGEGFVRDYLKISRYTTDLGLDTEIEGIRNNLISHGAKYPIVNSFSDNSDTIIKHDETDYLFYNNRIAHNYNSLMYEHDANNSRVVFLGWELSFLDNSSIFGSQVENYRNEFLYLLLNWFKYPGDLVELKVTSIDITVSDDNPNTGISYIINSDIFNYGHADSSTIVRFYDNDVIIDTDTIYVPAQGKSSAEIIWVPRFAGNRTINVVVDIANDVPEYFDSINNNASLVNTWVYFFYDNMEDGPSNWDHEATILRINGESTLDYIEDPVYTSINNTWADISGFNLNSSSFFSANSSFSAWEPTGITAKADVLLAIIIDDSASMVVRKDGNGNSWLDVAKAAAKFLVTQVSDISRVCIWHFKGNNEERALALTELTPAGRTTVNTAITNLNNPSGTTILWDAIGGGYQDVSAAHAIYQNLTPVVIVLSDGMDIQASDGSALNINVVDNKIEGGSDVWCPWHWMHNNNDSAQGFHSKYHEYHYGKYTYDWTDPVNGTVWLKAIANGSMTHTRRGLLNSDIRIYTVGLGLEHHEPEYEPVLTQWPGDKVPDYTYAMGNDTSPLMVESGTLEYNLWRIATSSDAMYFYSPTSDELRSVFAAIARELTEILTRAAIVGSETKHAVTGTFSLENVTSARLSFYHKFDLTEGYNGALVRVGMPNSTGGWDYKYIQPVKLYNGNLFLKRAAYDDYGTLMMWCWNGVSDDGLFDWEYAEFNLAEYIGQPRVRLNFSLVLWGGGNGGGWWVDNIEVRVSRGNAIPLTANSRDQWLLTNKESFSGNYSWWNGNPNNDYFTGGIDNSLMSRSIDLTNSRNASLAAFFKFNINIASGRPPDGFRVEISSDNGQSWKSINFGARSAWGVSGNDSDASDGVPNDGKSYTGINSGNYWVKADSLTRLNCDLSGWSGMVIKVRFRVITASNSNEFFGSQHYQLPYSTVGFGGFYVDDVIIHGFSQM
jgi:FlaG/FlaF family flagellin (archaellin)